MVPKDAIHTRAKRASLHIDPTSFHGLDASTSQSPRASATSQSPSTPVDDSRPSSSGSDLPKSEEEKAPALGPIRTESTAHNRKERERRKRSRVTPDQLVHLEQFFAVERSPTATRRKEISDMLGMEERQTQVWFQNRRAKAKLLQTKKEEQPLGLSTSNAPAELSKGLQSEMVALLHEDAPVTIIPCTDLSVGNWRRIASTSVKHDLVAYVCESKRVLAWFVLSSGHGFKMEVPFDTVTECTFTNAGPGTAIASFTLSKAPLFYLESPMGNTVVWTQCHDWTEGSQATKVLRHEVVGAAVQLAHLVQNLRERNHTADIYLHSPTYAGQCSDPGMVPHPSTLSEPPFPYIKSESLTPRPMSPFNNELSYGSHKPLHASRSLSSMSYPPPLYTNHQPHASSSFGSLYPMMQYADTGRAPITEEKHGLVPGYGDHPVPISAPMPVSSNPYYAQPVPRAIYREGPHFPETYDREAEHRAPTPTQQYHVVPSPPSLLTTPFYPSSHSARDHPTGSSTLLPESSGMHAPH